MAQVDEICQLAREKNFPRFTAYLDENNIDIHASLNFRVAVHALAKNGEHETIFFLRSYFNIDLADVVQGYAESGIVRKVNHLLANGAAIYPAQYGYQEGGFLSKERPLLYLLTLTTNPEHRLTFAKRAKLLNASFCVDEVSRKADKIRLLMQCYSLEYHQAKALFVKGALRWLLQGNQVMNERKDNHLPILPDTIYEHITGTLMRLSPEDVVKVYSNVNRVWQRQVHEIGSRPFKSGLFLVEKRARADDDQENQHRNTIK